MTSTFVRKRMWGQSKGALSCGCGGLLQFLEADMAPSEQSSGVSESGLRF